MNKETLYALEESIKHWEENVILAKEGTLEKSHIFGDECALCQRFAANCKLGYFEESNLCPVAKNTKQLDCKGTVWYEILELLNSKSKEGILDNIDKDKLLTKVIKMRDFLISLLPEEYHE